MKATAASMLLSGGIASTNAAWSCGASFKPRVIVLSWAHPARSNVPTPKKVWISRLVMLAQAQRTWR